MKKLQDKNNSISKILRAVCFLCAGTFMCLFLSEILSGYGRSLGTLSGFFISLSIMIYSLWLPRINRAIVNIRRRNKITRRLVASVTAVVLAGVTYVVAATSLMIFFSHKKAPLSDQAPVVVVLGCQVIGNQPCTLLAERIDTAYEYLSAHPESPCIVSGGQGSDEMMSEAECMYQELVKRGISPDRIYKEDQSTTTRENLCYSKEIMDRENLGDTIVIVTNAWHEFRAGLIATELTLAFGTEGAGTPLLCIPRNYMRELFGIVYQCLC